MRFRMVLIWSVVMIPSNLVTSSRSYFDLLQSIISFTSFWSNLNTSFWVSKMTALIVGVPFKFLVKRRADGSGHLINEYI